ncbi:peptidase [Amylibacter kogurei]|uniref:Peptidase n=1 Tax=Paramylibacter kogurei TaxID=1889778 RepID=A0A2G5K5Y6_9RHOB|nr:peptidase [Amylibacter kogurei]PIB24957.1 peptidase [Amylibacter kogurei]
MIISDEGRLIVASARQWIGTPYRHQSSTIAHGADCLGLVRGVWRDVLGAEPECPPAYTPDWSETGDVEQLWQAALRHLHHVDDRKTLHLGGVMLFRMQPKSVAKHLGIVAQSDAGFATLVHAYSGRGVVETPLTNAWLRRCVAQFRFPNRR